ncbi:DUF2848 domain-containing protein [Tepidamorphus sp. 3E244]|uniref:DUF2848 domain-containing protein n=1 Tax=Tepidamorphus sp. 3E244 TaxID=3385498 RepID=UPI0038FC6EC5
MANSAEKTLQVTLHRKDGSENAEATITRLIVAGWTGRDADAMEAHIRELEELGIPRPARTPIFYRNAVSNITTADVIEVTGDNTSGEAEFVVLRTGGETWIGIGSDHTDRELEKQGITVAKQICDKPVGTDFWLFDDVADHWDQLQLRATITENGKDVVYQEGPVAKMRPASQLIEMFGKEDASGLQDGDAMMGGTLAAIGGIRPASRFTCELIDPVLDRRISHSYEIVELPVEG